jgi:erythromycin esterase
LSDDAVEAAFEGLTLPVISRLQATRGNVSDAKAFQRMRMEDSFMDVPVFEAFDAIAFVPETSVSEEAQ